MSAHNKFPGRAPEKAPIEAREKKRAVARKKKTLPIEASKTLPIEAQKKNAKTLIQKKTLNPARRPASPRLKNTVPDIIRAVEKLYAQTRAWLADRKQFDPEAAALIERHLQAALQSLGLPQERWELIREQRSPLTSNTLNTVSHPSSEGRQDPPGTNSGRRGRGDNGSRDGMPPRGRGDAAHERSSSGPDGCSSADTEDRDPCDDLTKRNIARATYPELHDLREKVLSRLHSDGKDANQRQHWIRHHRAERRAVREGLENVRPGVAPSELDAAADGDPTYRQHLAAELELRRGVTMNYARINKARAVLRMVENELSWRQRSGLLGLYLVPANALAGGLP